MTFAEFAAKSPEKDPKKLIEDYRGEVQVDLLRNGEYDPQLMGDVDNQLLQHAKDQGIEMAGFGGPAQEDDTQFVARQAIHTGEQDVVEAADRLRALRDPGIKASYADRPDEYAAKLEDAQVGYEAVAPLEKREAARRAALNRGDIPFAAFTDKDGNRRIELGSEVLGIAGDDKALAELFAANPSLDRNLIPEVRRKLQTPAGFTAPLAKIERQKDFTAAFEVVAPSLKYQLDGLERAVSLGVEPSLTSDTKANYLEQADAALAGTPLAEQFSPEERKQFIRDYAIRNAPIKLDPDAPEKGLRTLSTGEVHIPVPLMMNKATFDKVLPSLPEGQREMAADHREQVVAAYAKDAFKTIAARRPEFTDEYAAAKAEGKSDTEILDAWTANPKNQSTAYEYVSGIAESIPGALVTAAAALPALGGNRAAASMIRYYDTQTQQRKEFANIVGKDLGMGYDIATMIAPVVVDIFATHGAAALARGTVGAAARAAIKPVVRGFFGATVREETKGLVNSFVKGAVNRELGREGLAALPGAAASLRPTEVLGAIGRDIEAGLSRAEYSSAMFASGFNRAAGQSYVQIYSTLEGLKNPDGSRKFDDAQVRDMAVKHATIVGTMTGLTTLGFNALGLEGTERIFSGGLTRKQTAGVFSRLQKDWKNMAPAVREGLDMTSADTMVASMMAKSLTPLWKVGVRGAAEEFPEEATQQFLEDITIANTTGEKFDVVKSLKGALYAGMLGGIMGAGATVSADVVSSPKADARREAATRRNALLETAAKLDANPNTQKTAAALREFALNGIPEAPAQEDVPEGVPAAGAESAPSGPAVASQPEDVEYFNYVMGEPATPGDPAAPVVKSKEELDAELEGIVQRFKSRKGPPITLEPIPLEHPDRIYLDQLPLKHPDRVLLDPIDVGDVALYGKGLTVEGDRILLDRVQLTRETGPSTTTTNGTNTETENGTNTETEGNRDAGPSRDASGLAQGDGGATGGDSTLGSGKSGGDASAPSVSPSPSTVTTNETNPKMEAPSEAQGPASNVGQEAQGSDGPAGGVVQSPAAALGQSRQTGTPKVKQSEVGARLRAAVRNNWTRSGINPGTPAEVRDELDSLAETPASPEADAEMRNSEGDSPAAPLADSTVEGEVGKADADEARYASIKAMRPIQRTAEDVEWANNYSRAVAEAEVRPQAPPARTADFLEPMTPMQRGKAKAALDVSMLRGGKPQTRKIIVEEMVDAGATIVDHPKDGRRLQKPDGAFIEERRLTKTGMEYAAHLIANSPAEQPSTQTTPQGPQADPSPDSGRAVQPDSPLPGPAPAADSQSGAGAVPKVGDTITFDAPGHVGLVGKIERFDDKGRAKVKIRGNIFTAIPGSVKIAEPTGQATITNPEAVLAAADIDPTPAERLVTDAFVDAKPGAVEAALAETPGGKKDLAEVINEAADEIITDGMLLGTMVGLGVVSENVKTLVAAEGSAGIPANPVPAEDPVGEEVTWHEMPERPYGKTSFVHGNTEAGSRANPIKSGEQFLYKANGMWVLSNDGKDWMTITDPRSSSKIEDWYQAQNTQQSLDAVRQQLPASAPDTRFTVKNSPVTKDLAAHGDLADIKAWLASVAKTGRPEHRELAKILLRFPDVLVTPVHLQDAPFAGTFVPQTGQVLINTARPGPRGGVDTVLHELVHAATHAAIKNPTPEQAQVLKRIDTIRKNIQKRAAKAGRADLAYGLGSLDEFFSHVFTSPAFQREVAAMTPKGERNWVHVLIDAVRDLLGLGKVPQGVLQDMIEFTQSAANLKYGRHAMTTDGKVLMLPAHHGTPHKVDKFSLDKIGTGEGAQAFGWGLYFAGDEGVAKSYAENLTNRKIESRVGELHGLIANAKSHLEGVNSSERFADQRASAEQKLQALQTELNEALASQGNLYTVEILPEEDEFLDWDKPLSEQSEKVQAAVREVLTEQYKGGKFEKLIDGMMNVEASTFYNQMVTNKTPPKDSPTGGGWGDMQYAYQGPKQASEALHAAGIKGIKYLDGNSRIAGEGTSNYVIFDGKDIQITHENGVPVTPEQATAPAPGPYGTSRMDALMQMPEDARDTARFHELTEDLGESPAQADIDAWREANPERYAELKAMRERVLREAGYEVMAYHGSQSKEGFSEFDPNKQGSGLGLVDGAGFYFTTSEREAVENTPYGQGVVIPAFLKLGTTVGRFQEGGDSVRYNLGSYDHIIVRDPNQIKSTEPLSLDPATGQLIPPSQWGDTESPSILFQPSEDAQEAPVSPEERLTASHDAGIAALDNATEAEATRLREHHELATTGNVSMRQRAQYRVDATALDRLVTYLRAAVKHLADSLKQAFNMQSAVHHDRLSRELAAAEDGYRIRSGVKAFDPNDAPLMQPSEEEARTQEEKETYDNWVGSTPFGPETQMVKVFRAAPQGADPTIRPGTWVSANEDYLMEYAGPDWKSGPNATMEVPASHLRDPQTGAVKGDTLVYTPPVEGDAPLFQLSEEDPSSVNYLRAHDGSHVLKFHEGEYNPAMAQKGIRAWLKNVFGTGSDLPESMDQARKSDEHMRAATETHFQNLMAGYAKAAKGMSEEQMVQIDGLLNYAVGDTAPMLTPTKEQELNDGLDAKLKAALELTTPEATAKAIDEANEWAHDTKIKFEIEEAEARIARRDKAQEELNRIHPELGAWAQRMRTVLTDTQKELLRRYGKDHPMYAKIDRSLGIYLVRSYAIHRDPRLADKILHDPSYQETRDSAVDFFEKQLANDMVEKLKGKTPGWDAMSEAEVNAAVEAQRVEDQVKRMKRSGDYASVDDATLLATAKLNVANQAQLLFEDLILGNAKTGNRSGVSGDSLKTNVSRFLEKKNIPEELRNALAEIRDPVWNATHTFAELSNLVHSHRMLGVLTESGIASGILVSQEKVKANPKKYFGWKPVAAADSRSRAYAPLAGYYANPENVEAFQAVFRTGSKEALDTAEKSANAAMKFMMGMAGFSLGVTTLGNIGFYLRNPIGGVFNLLSQGHNPLAAGALTAARGVARAAFDVQNNPDVEKGVIRNALLGKDDADTEARILELTALGIIGNGSQIGYTREILKMAIENPSGAMDAAQGVIGKGSVKLAELFAQGREKGKDFVHLLGSFAQVSEEVPMVIAYNANVDMLTRAQFGSPQAIKQEAARRAKLTVFAKSESSQGLKAFSHNPVAAVVVPFARFKGEVFRVLVNTYKLAREDMRSENPVIKAEGRKRMASALAVHGVLTVATPLLLAALSGIGGDEDRALRAAMPDYDKNTSFWFFRGADGVRSVSLTYLNPYSFSLDPVTGTLRSLMGGNEDQIPGILARVFTDEIFGENIVAGKVIDLKRNVDESTGLPLWLDTDDAATRASKMILHVASAYNPGVVKGTWRAFEASRRPEQSDQPWYYTPGGIMLGQLAPTKIRVHNLEDMAYRAFRDQARAQGQHWQITAPMRSPQGFPVDEVEDTYNTLRRADSKVQHDTYRISKGYESLGLDKRTLRQRMTDAGFSKEKSASILQGYGVKRNLSPDAIAKMNKTDPRLWQKWKELDRHQADRMDLRD